MPETQSQPDDELHMKESDFDAMMSGALGVPAPPEKGAKNKSKAEVPPAKKKQSK